MFDLLINFLSICFSPSWTSDWIYKRIIEESRRYYVSMNIDDRSSILISSQMLFFSNSYSMCRHSLCCDVSFPFFSSFIFLLGYFPKKLTRDGQIISKLFFSYSLVKKKLFFAVALFFFSYRLLSISDWSILTIR